AGMTALGIVMPWLSAGAQDFQSTTLSSDRYEYELKAAAAGEDSLWLAVGLRPKGSLGGPQQYQLWKLDSQGKQRAQLDLASVSVGKQADDKVKRLYDIAIAKNGDLAVLLESEGGKLALVVLSGSSGEVIVNKVVKAAHSNLFFSKLRVTSGGDLLAIGRTGDEGFLLKLRLNGEVTAETVIHEADLAVAFDALELNDSYIVAGGHLKPSGESSLWIGRITAKGDVLSRTTFAGRFGSLAHDDQAHRVVLIYDAPAANGWNIFIRAVYEGLGPL